jgi:hypothetical protein
MISHRARAFAGVGGRPWARVTAPSRPWRTRIGRRRGVRRVRPLALLRMAKCPYCDFNSHVAAEIDESRWNRAYLSEIARAGQETADRVLSTVFFGGGTPSLMSPDLVGAILETVRATWVVANDLEVTLEANPTSAEAGRFRGYRDAGVNRGFRRHPVAERPGSQGAGAAALGGGGADGVCACAGGVRPGQF